MGSFVGSEGEIEGSDVVGPVVGSPVGSVGDVEGSAVVGLAVGFSVCDT